jgi:hypothetical protein
MRGKLGPRFATTLVSGLTAVVLGAALAGTASAATRRGPDPVPIEPNQTFSGYINNHPPGNAVITVVCPGAANTGHPIGRQPVEVKPTPASTTQDSGFTGSKGKKITASLAYGPAIVHLDTFTSYYVPEFIPTSITVPCSGTGTVFFTPSPGSKTAKAALLTVTFVNIGA